MLSNKVFLRTLLSVVFGLFYAVQASADFESDVEKVFNWAQTEFPDFFSSDEASHSLNGWIYRYYDETNIYLAVSDTKDLWIYVAGSDVGPVNVAPLSSLMALIPEDALLMSSDGQSGMLNNGNGHCVKIKLPTVGMVMVRENIPVAPPPVEIPAQLAQQLTQEQLDLLSEVSSVSAESFFRMTEKVLESTLTRYKSKTETESASEVAGTSINSLTQLTNTVDSIIKNGYSYTVRNELHSESEGNYSGVITSYDAVMTYSPDIFGGPAETVCEKQSWYSASVTVQTIGSQTIDGVSSTINTSFDTGGSTHIIDAVNESVSVPAGTFKTVKFRSLSDLIDSYSIQWISIDYGFVVKTENYDTVGNMTGGIQLMSFSQ